MGEDVASVRRQVLAADGADYIVQPFIEQVRHGEKSLVFIGGAYLHAFLRLPAENDFRCNCWCGAKLIQYFPTSSEIEFGMHVIRTWERYLELPVHIGRVDFLGGDDGMPFILMEA